jgi:hypothetical protein
MKLPGGPRAVAGEGLTERARLAAELPGRPIGLLAVAGEAALLRARMGEAEHQAAVRRA